MKLVIENGSRNTLLWSSLNVLRWTGFLLPERLSPLQKTVRFIYAAFWFMFIVGIMTMAQIGDLVQIWGNVPLMVESSYLLFTYIVYILKVINLGIQTGAIFDIVKDGDDELNAEDREEGKAIVEDSNMDTIKQLGPLIFLFGGSVFSWGATEKRTLLFRAWYPFDVTESPAYELAYVHQSIAVMMLALTNGSFDILVISLAAVCRCRMKLLQLSLKRLFQDIDVGGIHLISHEETKKVADRLRTCIIKHQSMLESGLQLRKCFTYSILAQFTVSIVVLCVSAYQLGEVDFNNKFRLAFALAYLFSMVIQVFVYCYQGNYLSKDSMEIAETLYEIPWYLCPASIRRSLLMIMARSRRAIELTAGGFAILSLGCFMSIIKVSYSFFTVLQQAEK